jgi:hypothetical protein
MKAAATALIVAVAVVAAACGGEGGSPTPADQPTAAADASPAAGAANATSAPDETAVEFGKSARHSSTDDPEATYALVSGRYRLAWDTPTDNECERVEVAVTQVDGDFEYVKSSTSARFNATVNDLPQGSYKLQQLDPDCTEWDLRIDWMTN